jgi:hypothetical protein
MSRWKLAAGVTAVAALLVATGATPALAAGWTVVPAPPTGEAASVTGISAPTATDAWAVGDEGTGSITGAFTDHWNGTTWSQVPIPTFPCNGVRCYVHLFSVSASATDAWALGVYSAKPGYKTYFTLHWNGSAWTAGDGQLGYSLDDVSSTDAAAAAGYVVEQWNGTGWASSTPPNPPGPDEGYLTAVSATSASDVWAVGTYDPAYSSSIYDNYSVYWNGTAWTEVAMPAPASSDPDLDYQINAIDAISPTNVWAVGEVGDNVASFYASGGGGTAQSALIEHYNGTSWSIVANPSGSPASLVSVTATSASNVWAVGGAFTENWNGSAWATVAIPEVGTSDGLASVSTSLGAAAVWAAGNSNSGTSASTNPLVLVNG